MQSSPLTMSIPVPLFASKWQEWSNSTTQISYLLMPYMYILATACKHSEDKMDSINFALQPTLKHDKLNVITSQLTWMVAYPLQARHLLPFNSTQWIQANSACLRFENLNFIPPTIWKSCCLLCAPEIWRPAQIKLFACSWVNSWYATVSHNISTF